MTVGGARWFLDGLCWWLVLPVVILFGSPSGWRWYRKWIGGHWERWYLDTPMNTMHWFHHAYCREECVTWYDGRPGLGRGTPMCEEWPVLHRFWSLGGLGRLWAYTSYIARHKWFVAVAGWRCSDTWHEFALCLLHDNNKFHPAMFGPYATHFYEADGAKRTRRGADGFYDDVDDDLAFDRAWLWHIQRSKHHPQYWCKIVSLPCRHHRRFGLLQDDGGIRCLWRGCGWSGSYLIAGQCDPHELNPGIVPVIVHEMPREYITEMLCDWMGAGLAQGTPNTLAWYTARGHRLPMGPNTRALVEQRLGYER